jgi:Respiratory-chain NADH dehydrogenase, 30 Kd subunit
VAVTPELWTAAADELSGGRAALLGLWGESRAGYSVHLALIGENSCDIAVLSLACPDMEFPSVARVHAPAIRLERALHSLYGLRPIGIPDSRPWLDLGFWDTQFPLGARSAPVRRLMPFSRLKAKTCIRFLSDRCTPVLSSPGTFASLQRAKRWPGSRSGLATSTKGSNR